MFPALDDQLSPGTSYQPAPFCFAAGLVAGAAFRSDCYAADATHAGGFAWALAGL